MREIGIVATVLACAAVAVGLVVAVMSISDIQRYLRIRRM
ncbi:DUF6893 family small protein [Aeromicrobium sp.]